MGKVTVKARPLIEVAGYVNHRAVVTSNGFTTGNDVPYSILGNQYTVSRSHPEFFIVRRYYHRLLRRYRDTGDPWYKRRAELVRGMDYGGKFYTASRMAQLDSPYVNIVGATGSTGLTKHYVQGRFLPGPGYSSIDYKSIKWPALPTEVSVHDALVAKGAVAISRTIPTSPEVSVANLVGELRRDGIPAIIGSILTRARTLKSVIRGAGEEYLNYEFGWKPFVSDLTDLLATVRRSKEILEQFERDSGRLIGRNYEFPVQRTTSIEDKGQTPLFPTVDTKAYIGATTGSLQIARSVTERYWFEGVYSYHLPLASSSRDKVFLYAAEAERLLGLRITPEVLWNLAPWSWLSDWFFNVGSIATNLSAFSSNSLMLKRGYIMCHRIAQDVATNTGVTLRGWGATGPISLTLKSEVKSRSRATPWGFGVTFSEFTPKQIAILSALGITRDLTWGK